MLAGVAARQEAEMRERFGDAGPYALLAMGKLGGREMSYHSDLDLILVYAGEGRSTGTKPLDHYEYFTEYARRLIKALSQHGPLGRLYVVHLRLRPTGHSGRLVDARASRGERPAAQPQARTRRDDRRRVPGPGIPVETWADAGRGLCDQHLGLPRRPLHFGAARRRRSRRSGRGLLVPPPGRGPA